MKGLIIGLAMLFSASAPALAASWETTSFRTEAGGLVRVGMSAEAARRELGPALRHGKKSPSGKKSETWSYRGRDGDYRITVVRGKVERIVVTPAR